MGENSNISWCDHSWNPWQGCHKVSPGCQKCYMFRDKKRYGQDPENIHRSSVATFSAPLKWKDPARVFVCSWSDFFIEEADEWRNEAWDIMRLTPHLTYLLLTKRPENIATRLPAGWPFKNVWLGVTAENQEQYDRRVMVLNQFVFIVPVLFVSIEPMLGPIHLHSVTPKMWVICGGESGPHAREMDLSWAESLKDRCEDLGVPFFMKQMSGKTKAEREAIPPHIDIQEFPKLR